MAATIARKAVQALRSLSCPLLPAIVYTLAVLVFARRSRRAFTHYYCFVLAGCRERFLAELGALGGRELVRRSIFMDFGLIFLLNGSAAFAMATPAPSWTLVVPALAASADLLENMKLLSAVSAMPSEEGVSRRLNIGVVKFGLYFALLTVLLVDAFSV